MAQEHTLPSWDLRSLWSGIDSDEYKKSLGEYKDGMAQLQSILDTAQKFRRSAEPNFDFPKWLSTWYPLYDKFGALEESLGAYAYLLYSADTTNPALLNNLAAIKKMSLQSKRIHVEFQQVLAGNKDKLREFYARFPEFAQYEFAISEELEDAEHKMGAELEDLASDLQRTGGEAWGSLQEQIISTLADPDSGKTFNELRNDAYSDDARLRRSSYAAELRLLEQNKVALAACLNNLKGETLSLASRRKWNGAIERALFSSRMSRKTLSALIAAIESSLPDWQKYLLAKAGYLRKKGLTCSEDGSALAFYDLFAPVGNSAQKQWTFEEARDFVIERYASFSAEMGEFAREAFDSGWIDAKIHAGKVGGAYCQDFPMQGESRVLVNFTGAFSDVITLAHELGHAYHFYCICRAKNPYELSHYPMPLAETASTFAETIVKQEMIRAASDDAQRLHLIELDLQDACQVLVDILSRYYFEARVFELRGKGELVAEDFCRLMVEAQRKAYGSGLNSELHPYLWAVKSHYYGTELDFYNFPYAFGQLLSCALYGKYREQGGAFAQRYGDFLAATGRMDCEDVCQSAGFDITSTDFWNAGLSLYRGEIEEFVRLCEKEPA